MDAPKCKTIFCDIDGTLIEHKGNLVKNNTEPISLLPSTLDQIIQWDKHSYKIILTTSRKESMRAETAAALTKAGIIYDEMIMGLPNGDRVLINDRKPHGIRNTAYAINLVRNSGLEGVDLTSPLTTTLPNQLCAESNDKYNIRKYNIPAGKTFGPHEFKLATISIIITSGRLTQLGSDEPSYRAGEMFTIKPYTKFSIYTIEESNFYVISSSEFENTELAESIESA